ncbi:MAG: AbrB family transcriptional regulator [Oscillatoriophycideae cyanobacterium NC_groundwater_1537_Pr4_S-0.65um_50_18]|nr:AbrB family transcriptional regulator [Oscillatoriophycideae cyanobacterium NC_groundwater_1537_Pr4_S-0.65um_50_18]
MPIDQDVLLSDRLPSHSAVSVEAAALPPSLLRSLAILSLELLLTLPLGFGLAHLKIGGTAWIFSGVAAGILVLQGYRLLRGVASQPNTSVRKVGQALVGMTIGFAIANSDLTNVLSHLPIFLLLTLLMLSSGSAIGYFYARLSQTSLLTALLATVPGGVSIMASFAADYGRNVALVSLVQVMRVTTVVVLIPLLARATAAQNAVQNAIPLPALPAWINLEPMQLELLAIALLLAGLGAFLAIRLKVPSPPFFGALVAGVVFHPLLASLPFVPDFDFSPPRLVNIVGQSLLGITIGEYWGNKPKIHGQMVGFAVLSVSLTIASGFLTALLAFRLTDWDWLTCMLVAAPGGAPEMIVVALTLNHDIETITAAHLVRLIAINSLLPLLILLFRFEKTEGDRPISESQAIEKA